jgi:hypothetical protein
MLGSSEIRGRRHVAELGRLRWLSPDGFSDVLWQNDSSEAVIWEMNGTTVIGAAGLGNPGPDWHIMGTGDYNKDGKSDILRQNSSGAVAVWEMNGTSVLAAVTIANPDPTCTRDQDYGAGRDERHQIGRQRQPAQTREPLEYNEGRRH